MQQSKRNLNVLLLAETNQIWKSDDFYICGFVKQLLYNHWPHIFVKRYFFGVLESYLVKFSLNKFKITELFWGRLCFKYPCRQQTYLKRDRPTRIHSNYPQRLTTMQKKYIATHNDPFATTAMTPNNQQRP